MPHETMSAAKIAVRIAAGVVLTLANAFFVVTEFALTRLRQLPEEEFRDHPGLRRAWKMTEELEIYLTGCQVGISLSSILLGIVTEPAVSALLYPLFEAVGLPERVIPATSVVIAVVVLNLIHKIWGEQAPTYLGVAVSTSRSIEENLATMASDHLSRFPLVGESLDDFRGILYLPEVFRAYDALRAGETTLEEIAVEPLVVPAGLPVSHLIDRFQHAHQELALVEERAEERDDGGAVEANGGRRRIVGLVTVTEAFEAISGDLEDPYD